MEEPLRLRVVFDDRHLLTKPQRSEGLKRCWILLNPEVSTIADLADHLTRRFSLHRSCPHGVILTMDNYVLPTFESSCIFKDKDIIRVKKKGGCVKEITEKDDVLCIQDSGNVEKQPIYLRDKLLAIQEFEEDSQRYKSNEEDYTGTLDGKIDHMENPIGGKLKSKRKRNHSHILHGSKTKKAKVTVVLEQDITAGDAEECNFERNQSCSPKKATIRSSENNDKPLKQINKHKPRPVVSAGDIVDDAPSSVQREKRTKKAKATSAVKPDNISSQADDAVNDTPSSAPRERRTKKAKATSAVKPDIISSQADGTVNDTPSSVPRERSYDRVEANCCRDTCEPHASAAVGKGPSRSARRKKAKRQIRKEMIKSQMNEPPTVSQVPPVDTTKKSPDNQVVNEVPLNVAQKKSTEDQLTQKNEAGDVVVPVIIRPGHIRFEPLGEEHSMQQSKGPVEMLQWNGTTNKKMGQKWGREKTVYRRAHDNVRNWEPSQELIAGEVNLADHKNFESLHRLSGLPKVGDVIAYRMVELSESWCPELSSFRVGKVISYDSISMKIVLAPVPGYPIIPTNGEADELHSLYKEDGSLEIDYSSLVDARLLKANTSEEITENSLQRHTDKVAVDPDNRRKGPVADTSITEKDASPTVTQVSNWELASSNNGVEGKAPTDTPAINWGPPLVNCTVTDKVVTPASNWGTPPVNRTVTDKVVTPASNWSAPLVNRTVTDKVVTPEKGPDMGWEQITQALDKKKSELSSNKDGWGNWTPNKDTTTPPWSYRALRRSAVGPTVSFLRSRNRRHA